jgi:hypothetical protein
MDVVSHSIRRTEEPRTSEKARPFREHNLAGLDWNFAQRSKAHDIEGIHPYPAKFIGDIPRLLIEKLPLPAGAVVLDPFCGSGTALVEAQRAGIPSVGIDLNPIACLITRVKTSPLCPGFADASLEVVARARAITSVRIPYIPNLDHWFKPEIQTAVGALTESISHIEYLPWLDQPNQLSKGFGHSVASYL